MNKHDILSLTRAGENTTTEYKEAKSKMPSSLFETVASFLNRDGGTILLGVSDDGIITGIDPAAEGITLLSTGVVTFLQVALGGLGVGLVLGFFTSYVILKNVDDNLIETTTWVWKQDLVRSVCGSKATGIMPTIM